MRESLQTVFINLICGSLAVPKESEVPAGLLGSTTSAAKEPITEGAAHESTPSGPVVATTHNGTTASPSSPVAKSASPIAGGVQGVEKVAPNVTQASASGTGVSVNGVLHFQSVVMAP